MYTHQNNIIPRYAYIYRSEVVPSYPGRFLVGWCLKNGLVCGGGGVLLSLFSLSSVP